MKPTTEAGVSPGRREKVSGAGNHFRPDLSRPIIEKVTDNPGAYSRECGCEQQISIQIRLPEPWERFPHGAFRFSELIGSVL